MNTLLIVEDEKLIRQGIKAMVQRSGVPVENILECSNGRMALEILKMQKVDVMLTDICMPEMDGIALVRAMQELPEKPLTVAVSGYDDFSYAVEMMRNGVREYLLKPVDRDKIREILEKLNLEIEAGRESLRMDLSLGCQQLKYVIMNRNLAESEKELLIRQYGGSLFAGNYYVVCTNDTGGESMAEAEAPYIYLSGVEGREFYIVAQSHLSILLREEFKGRYVGISAQAQGLEALRPASSQADAARKEAFFMNRPAVHFERMVTTRPGGVALEEASLLQIVQLLGTDKYEAGLRQLERIFKNAALGGYAPETVENGMRILLDGVKSTYAGILKVDEKEIESYCDIYHYSCMEEYAAEVTGWLTDFCETVNSRFDDYKNKQKIQQAVVYIRENFDKDLNMAVVSNHISMNYSLFSYVFKQYTGSNFVNYLKDIRIEEARRLLVETDMKVVDISMKVGYENEKHFMKIFKAACGVSPTEYRRNSLFKE